MDAGSRVNKNAVSYYYCYFLLAGLTWHAKWFVAFVTLKSGCLVNFHKKVLRPGFNMVRDEGRPLATSSLRSLRNSWGRLLASLHVWEQFSPWILAQQVRDHSSPVRQKICASDGWRGSGMRNNVWNLGARCSETSFPHFKTYFTQIGRCYL